MEVIMLIVGAAIAALGAFMLWDDKQFRKQAINGRGTVVAMSVSETRSRNSSSTEVYAPVVQYEIDGETHEFTARVASSHVSHSIGDPVDILINRNDPSDARLVKSPALAIAYAMMAFGLAFVIAFFIIFPISLHSIAIAALIFGIILLQLYFKARKHGIRSIEDLKQRAQQVKKQGPLQTANKAVTSSKQVITEQGAFQRHTRQKKKVPVWLVAVFMMVGIGMLAGGVFLTKQRAEFLNSALASQGKVVDFKRSTSHSEGRTTTTYYPIVVYSPQNSDQQIRFEHDVGSSNPSFRTGEIVPVLYSAANPSEAIINQGWLNWLGPLILCTMGAIFFLVSFFMLKQQRKLRQEDKTLSLDL